jgi:hypothetical protein
VLLPLLQPRLPFAAYRCLSLLTTYLAHRAVCRKVSSTSLPPDCCQSSLASTHLPSQCVTPPSPPPPLPPLCLVARTNAHPSHCITSHRRTSPKAVTRQPSNLKQATESSSEDADAADAAAVAEAAEARRKARKKEEKKRKKEQAEREAHAKAEALRFAAEERKRADECVVVMVSIRCGEWWNRHRASSSSWWWSYDCRRPRRLWS